MAKTDYDKMDLSELDAEIIRLSNEEAPREQRLAATQAYDRAYARNEVERKLGNMTAEEKRILHQVVQANGIIGDEQAGTPGT